MKGKLKWVFHILDKTRAPNIYLNNNFKPNFNVTRFVVTRIYIWLTINSNDYDTEIKLCFK
jgi:hypothetical protein